jgi:hypothetical protein
MDGNFGNPKHFLESGKRGFGMAILDENNAILIFLENNWVFPCDYSG